MAALNLLVLTDLHYVNKADHVCKLEKRKTRLIPELIEKVRAEVEEESIDLILLCGDLTDNGKAKGAIDDLAELKTRLESLTKPVLSVRGNHDADKEVFHSILGKAERVKINGYTFLCFSDHYEADDTCFRDFEEMERLFSQTDPDSPIVVVQHSPIYPPIEDEYPYNLSDADRLMEYYQKRNVLLSVSGHLHIGAKPLPKDGVEYFTASALCEEPFSFTVIRLRDREIEYSFRNLGK